MGIAVRVQAKVTGQRRASGHEVVVELPEGEVRARDLLSAVVGAEVAAFDRRAEEQTFLRVLTEGGLAAGLAAGRVSSGGAEPAARPDPDDAIAAALLAFEDGIVKVFVGDDEVVDLAAPVAVRPGVELLFLRLVPLAGG